MQQLQDMENDLLHTGSLLDEAIHRLTASFTAIHQLVNEQQAEMDALLTQYPLLHQRAHAIREMREVIGDEVRAVVTGLQFHDLVSQLLAHTVGRISELRVLITALSTDRDEKLTGQVQEKLAALLAMRGSVSEFVPGSAPASGSCRQVRQQHMGGGDVELF